MDEAKRAVGCTPRDFLAAWGAEMRGRCPGGACSACCYYPGVVVDEKRDRKRLAHLLTERSPEGELVLQRRSDRAWLHQGNRLIMGSGTRNGRSHYRTLIPTRQMPERIHEGHARPPGSRPRSGEHAVSLGYQTNSRSKRLSAGAGPPPPPPPLPKQSTVAVKSATPVSQCPTWQNVLTPSPYAETCTWPPSPK